MERLEPIIKQKFWILLGVGIVMTITGWWLATSALAKTITDRTKAVKDAFGVIPSGEIPNNNWSQQLAARNTEQERAVNRTRSLLWERQLGRMTWPESVYPFVWQNGYRGEIGLAGREIYRNDYGHDVRRVWESVRPFNTVDGSGIVYFGQDEKILPQQKWGRLAPSSAEMWDAQEDLWLLESLLRSIVDVNGGPKATRGDASIHMIEKLTLHGGIPKAQRKSSSGGAPAGPGGSGTGGTSAAPAGAHGGGPGPGAATGGFGGSGSGGSGGDGRSAAQLGPAPADFDPKDEFGDDGSSRGGGGGGGAFGGGPSGAHSAGPGPGAPGAPGGAGSASNSARRYIEDDAALPFKTRGFYMTLVMDHQKIPSLISELTASDKSAWPVEIVRVQMVRVQDNDIDSRSGSGGGPGGPGASSGFNPLPSGGGSRSIGFPAGGSPGLPNSFEGSESFTSDAATDAGNNPSSAAQAMAATAALRGAMQDPFIARVAICGIITLYKEVKPEPVVTAPVVQPAAAPQATPVATPAAPTDPAAAPTDPAAPPDSKSPTDNVPADDKKPSDPAETPPAKPAIGEPATPPDPAAKNG